LPPHPPPPWAASSRPDRIEATVLNLLDLEANYR
jgi:hypothetical protein